MSVPSTTAKRTSTGAAATARLVTSAVCREPAGPGEALAAIVADEHALAAEPDTPAPARRRAPARAPGRRRPVRRRRSTGHRRARTLRPARPRSRPCPRARKASANTAPMIRPSASGTQPRPPLCERSTPRSVPTSRRAGIARIDRDRQRRAQKQADIGMEPGGAEIAGAEQAAIGAGIMRRRPPALQRATEAMAKPNQRTGASEACGSPSRRRRAREPRDSHARHLWPQCGLRDFSPGASVISAMREPFRPTQEFLVSGYLSV